MVAPSSSDDHYGRGIYLRKVCRAHQLPPYSKVVQLRTIIGICKVCFFFFWLLWHLGFHPFCIYCVVAVWHVSWPRVMPKLAEGFLFRWDPSVFHTFSIFCGSLLSILIFSSFLHFPSFWYPLTPLISQFPPFSQVYPFFCSFFLLELFIFSFSSA